MRSFWFAAKIAVLFALVIGVVLTGTMLLFGRVAGHGMHRELGALRAHQGAVIAERIEELLHEHSLDDPAVRSLVAGAERPWGNGVSLRRVDGTPSGPEGEHGCQGRGHELEIRGRRCRILGPPAFETRVPILQQGSVVGLLTLRWSLHPKESHTEFLAGVFEIGAVTLAGIVGLSLYLTAPLRRMARSMDRIAAGDLEHRVPVRGRDEVAAMGRSFNAMADRIRGMILGQKELMAGVSHELRSPLTRMKMVLELLRDGGVPGERVADLESEVDALDSLVEELLVASRLDLGSARLAPEEAELRELAREAWTRVAASAAESRMELVLRLPDDARRIRGDRALVVRILGNLFENAVRHAGCGPVTVSAQRQADRVEITVSDAGSGVDDELLDRLFEPFFRADPSRSRKTGATGLGLMIVRRAVEAHGGSVRAEHAAAGGLAITFDLPDGCPEGPP